MAKGEFRHESLQDPRSVASYLEALIAGLQAGRLDLSDDDSHVALHPRGLLRLELRAKRRGNRSKLQLELSWSEEAFETQSAALRVSAGPTR